MKALIKSLYVFLFPLAAIIILSCENRTDNIAGKGKAEFSLNMPDGGAKSLSGISLDSGIVSYHVMVSIEDMEGHSVVADSLIPLYSFGTGFTSENIELQTGEYNLTKFLVINPSGTVVFAAPMEGSPLAYLVNDPLPVSFAIQPDFVTIVAPEVLEVGDQGPGQFGYANFGMQIIKPLGFWTICILDCPLCMRPTELTTAKLTVFANNGWKYTFKLEAALNHLIIRGGSEVYYFLLEKEGYMPLKLRFTASELHATTKEYPLVLRIPWDSNQWQTFVLQPGPEEGKDAMVTNLEPDKNFGAHKYFEATFLSEPLLTVMRLNRSLIEFRMPQTFAAIRIHKVKLRLSFEVPIPWDSTIFVGTNSTNFIGGVLQQVIEPWEENSVTWNRQPKTIEANQVFIPPFIRNVNFIEVDVTSLFVPNAEISAPNYGMLFRLWPEDRWPGFRFASSDHPNPVLRPMLTVYYTNM